MEKEKEKEKTDRLFLEGTSIPLFSGPLLSVSSPVSHTLRRPYGSHALPEEREDESRVSRVSMESDYFPELAQNADLIDSKCLKEKTKQTMEDSLSLSHSHRRVRFDEESIDKDVEEENMEHGGRLRRTRRSNESEKKKRLERRAKRMFRRKLAGIVARQWKYVARRRICDLRFQKHQRRKLLVLFKAWQQHVWESRHEWKLNVIAATRFRICSAQKYFANWMEFTQKSKHQREKNVKAVLHGRRLMTRHMVKRWHNYTLDRRQKNGKADLALKLLRKVWETKFFRQWKARSMQADTHKMLLGRADAYHRHGVVKNVFDLWRRKFQHRLDGHRMDQMAIAFSEMKMMIHAIQRWKVFHEEMRALEEESDRLSRLFDFRRLRFLFEGWRIMFERKRNRRIGVHKMQRNRDDLLTRNAFSTWTKELRRRQRMRRLSILVETFDRNRLLKHGFIAFREFRAKKYKRIWERNQILHFSVKKMFEQWKRSYQRHAKIAEEEKIQRAEMFYRKRFLSQIFQYFKTFAKHSKQEKFLANAALSFSRRVVLPIFYSHWKRLFLKRKMILMLAQSAKKTYHIFLLRRTMHRWKLFLQMKRHQHDAEARATLYHKKILKKTGLTHWIAYWRDRVGKIQRMRDGIRANYKLLVQRYFKRLTHMYQVAKRHSLMKITSDNFRRKALLRRSLDRMRSLILERDHFRLKVGHAVMFWKNLVVARAFNQWLIFIDNCRKDREKLARAVRQFQCSIGRKMLRVWRSYCEESGKETMQMVSLANEFRGKQDRSMLRTILDEWIRYSQDRMFKRMMALRAVTHRERFLLHKSTMRWCRFVEKKRLERIRWGLALRHHTTKMLVMSIRRWIQFRDSRRRRNHVYNQADRLHSLRLMRDSFHKLFRYGEYSIEKKRRRHDAMVFRKNNLLLRGCRKWLEVGTSLISKDHQAIAAIHAQRTEKTMRLVQRIARHWMHKSLSLCNRRDPIPGKLEFHISKETSKSASGRGKTSRPHPMPSPDISNGLSPIGSRVPRDDLDAILSRRGHRKRPRNRTVDVDVDVDASIEVEGRTPKDDSSGDSSGERVERKGLTTGRAPPSSVPSSSLSLSPSSSSFDKGRCDTRDHGEEFVSDASATDGEMSVKIHKENCRDKDKQGLSDDRSNPIPMKDSEKDSAESRAASEMRGIHREDEAKDVRMDGETDGETDEEKERALADAEAALERVMMRQEKIKKDELRLLSLVESGFEHDDSIVVAIQNRIKKEKKKLQETKRIAKELVNLMEKVQSGI
eukprot:TRINITY_DN478_c0_g1_i6.p1 TRINITY_DN478_c0_g1~~TRINITY_DN478_c0_g1_i6.p1  ORF type:complete len:1266 (+),score=333.39 TRINITY_DN478_c0_g1_i6:197-3994(+)